MSFLSKLEIDGHTFILDRCTSTIDQNSDYNGRPNSAPIAGKFTIALRYEKKADLFAEWAVSSTLTKNGKIIFYNSDSMSTLQSMEFKDAYCLHYAQDYDGNSNKPMTVQMVISAKDIKVGVVEHNNNWPTKH